MIRVFYGKVDMVAVHAQAMVDGAPWAEGCWWLLSACSRSAAAAAAAPAVAPPTSFATLRLSSPGSCPFPYVCMTTWCTVAPASFEAKYSETAWYGSGSLKDATTTWVVVACGGGSDSGGNGGTAVSVSVAPAKRLLGGGGGSSFEGWFGGGGFACTDGLPATPTRKGTGSAEDKVALHCGIL